MALNNVPLAGQTLAQTRDPIANNFTTIDTAFSIDHVAYAAGGQGKHNKITLPVQGGAPAFAAGENGFYNMNSGVINEIYINKQSNAGVQQIPMTASILSGSTPGLAAGGWTILPSGIFMVWGTGNANGLTTVNLVGAFPAVAIFNVQVVPYTPAALGYVNASVRVVDIINNNTFRVFGALNGAAGPIGFMYFVVGY